MDATPEIAPAGPPLMPPIVIVVRESEDSFPVFPDGLLELVFVLCFCIGVFLTLNRRNQ